MNILPVDDFVQVINDHPLSVKFTVRLHSDNSISMLPHNFFRDWMDVEPEFGEFSIGRCSGMGIGSSVRYDSDKQKLTIGRFVAGGWNLRFLLNGQHETGTMAMASMGALNRRLRHPPMPGCGDTILKNDIWIGDETMILGGSVIENGCIIGARTLIPTNFSTELYGIYVGSPAKLVKFRFSEKLREALLDLAWWEMPVSWIAVHNDAFMQKLEEDEGKSLEMLAELKRSTTM